jgi:hypothetical protein
MPVVLVIIILVAWVVILGPSLLKRRARSGGDQSISHFHYQLRVLEQRAPEPIVAPAYRLRAVDGSGAPTAIVCPDTGRPPVLTVVGAKELPRPALAFLGEPEMTTPGPSDDSPEDRPVELPPAARLDDRRHLSDLDAYPGDPPVGLDLSPRGPEAYTRAQARRRRQDTLTVLGAVLAVTFMAGLVTGSSFVWAVVALDAVALGAYVGLLVHLRRRAQEREMKLHYLEPRADRPEPIGGLPTYVSGRYAHPSNQQAIAR